jgi:hypothetical protein
LRIPPAALRLSPNPSFADAPVFIATLAIMDVLVYKYLD